MAFITIKIIKKYGNIISCEKCGSENTSEALVFEAFPTRLCHSCRRQFEYEMRNNGEYKAMLAAQKRAYDPELNQDDQTEAWNLYLDIQTGLKAVFDAWLLNDEP